MASSATAPPLRRILPWASIEMFVARMCWTSISETRTRRGGHSVHSWPVATEHPAESASSTTYSRLQPYARGVRHSSSSASPSTSSSVRLARSHGAGTQEDPNKSTSQEKRAKWDRRIAAGTSHENETDAKQRAEQIPGERTN